MSGTERYGYGNGMKRTATERREYEFPRLPGSMGRYIIICSDRLDAYSLHSWNTLCVSAGKASKQAKLVVLQVRRRYSIIRWFFSSPLRGVFGFVGVILSIYVSL